MRFPSETITELTVLAKRVIRKHVLSQYRRALAGPPVLLSSKPSKVHYCESLIEAAVALVSSSALSPVTVTRKVISS